MGKHYALYGNVGILRQYCHKCKSMAFVIDKIMQCCDSPVEHMSADRVSRVTNPRAKRQRPSGRAKVEILYKQSNRCLYCDVKFDTHFIHYRTGKIRKLSACWDHVVPYAYSQNNNDLNFVAACSVCNGIKSSKLFETLEEARAYVQYNRAKKGITEENYC